MLESRLPIEAITVMVQKEVAVRIAAKPGSADYSAFTVFCQFYGVPEILFDVPAHCFLPQPKVTSAVIHLKVRENRPWDIADEAIFFRCVKASFAMRRKKLSNGLASGFPELGKDGAAEVIAEETGGQVMTLHSCHNVSKEDFSSGKGYLDLMRENLDVLRKALG